MRADNGHSLCRRNQGQGLAGGDEWLSATEQGPGLRPDYSAVYLMSLFKASCVSVTENKHETPSLPTPAFPCIGNFAAGPGPLFQSLSLDSSLLSSRPRTEIKVPQHLYSDLKPVGQALLWLPWSLIARTAGTFAYTGTQHRVFSLQN